MRFWCNFAFCMHIYLKTNYLNHVIILCVSSVPRLAVCFEAFTIFSSNWTFISICKNSKDQMMTTTVHTVLRDTWEPKSLHTDNSAKAGISHHQAEKLSWEGFLRVFCQRTGFCFFKYQNTIPNPFSHVFKPTSSFDQQWMHPTREILRLGNEILCFCMFIIIHTHLNYIYWNNQMW